MIDKLTLKIWNDKDPESDTTNVTLIIKIDGIKYVANRFVKPKFVINDNVISYLKQIVVPEIIEKLIEDHVALHGDNVIIASEKCTYCHKKKKIIVVRYVGGSYAHICEDCIRYEDKMSLL
jgi:hypothetical protein